jgi:hypothetical protein
LLRAEHLATLVSGFIAPEPIMPARRDLSFQSLEDVMPEVDRLIAGHRIGGTWTLAQICHHLSLAIRATVEGRTRQMPWIFRRTIGRVILGRIFRTGRFPEGVQAYPEFVPKPDLDARAEAEALRATLRLYAAEHGPFGEHPILGPMSPDDWNRFHCLHCAHHLSFVLPESPG